MELHHQSIVKLMRAISLTFALERFALARVCTDGNYALKSSAASVRKIRGGRGMPVIVAGTNLRNLSRVRPRALK